MGHSIKRGLSSLFFMFLKGRRNDMQKSIEHIKGQLLEIKTELNKVMNDVQFISYFTYSLNLAHEVNGENLCLGSFHIRNIGHQTITNPYICIHLPKDSPFSFTGKYVYPDQLQRVKNPGMWERMNERDNLEQFWLKPLERQSIKPNESLTFSNFQIKWTPTEKYAGSIMGFTYSETHQEGIAAVNAINLSGAAVKKAGNHEGK